MTSTAAPVPVAVVNDYPVVTAGIAALLAPLAHRVRVEEFPGQVPPRGRVEVVLFDAFGHPSPELRLKEILTETGAKVLVYSWASEPEQLDAVRRIGAAGFLSKTVDAEEIVTAVETVHAGQGLWPASTTPTDAETGAMPAWPGQAEGLTAREGEIVSLIVAGLTNQEIARSCYLSINSVKTYVRTAYRKMGVQTRAQALLWGIDHGFRFVGSSAAEVPPHD
jgi:two-component system, NarL family, response regulator LiaR